MLNLNDPRWDDFRGGYRTRFDPRPHLLRLEAKLDTAAAWGKLWNELHHQGDVGDASYAAVPHIVRIYREQGGDSWNTYAIVAIIELARTNGKNSDVPIELKDDYFQAIRDLAEIAAVQVLQAKAVEDARAILSILALGAGARTYARILVGYSEEELLGIEELS